MSGGVNQTGGEKEGGRRTFQADGRAGAKALRWGRGMNVSVEVKGQHGRIRG